LKQRVSRSVAFLSASFTSATFFCLWKGVRQV
jgi:hypothetical protein